MTRVLVLALVFAVSGAVAQTNSDAPPAPDAPMMPGVPEYKQNPPQLAPDGLPPMYETRTAEQSNTKSQANQQANKSRQASGSTHNETQTTTPAH